MRAIIFVLYTLIAMLVGCANTNRTNSDKVQATTPKPTGATYTSRLGNFTCKVPHLTRPGAHQREKGDADAAEVEFDDDFGRLLRIESVRIPPDLAARITSHTLDGFFDRSVFPLFRAVSPQAAVLHREHAITAAGPALFTVVSIPQGSSLASVDVSGQTHRLDSVRGVLLFTQRGFIYVIMNQEWGGGSNLTQGPLQTQFKRLLDDLQQVVSGMTFQSAATPPAKKPDATIYRPGGRPS